MFSFDTLSLRDPACLKSSPNAVFSCICRSLGEELFERPVILMEIFGVRYHQTSPFRVVIKCASGYELEKPRALQKLIIDSGRIVEVWIRAISRKWLDIFFSSSE